MPGSEQKKKAAKHRRFLERTINEYRPQLHRFLRSKLGNEADVEDIAQESYLRLLRVDAPELIRRPQDYLFRIASNAVHDFYLKRSREPAQIDCDTATDLGEDSDAHAFEDELARRETCRKLEFLIAELPALQRAAFILKKRDGLSHNEIATRLGISVNTARAYVARALAHCRMNWKA